MKLFKQVFFAFRYLTIMSLQADIEASDEPGALTFFPLVGLIAGAVIAALGFAAQYFYPTPALWAVICVTTAFILTGGLHQSALASVCDALLNRAQKQHEAAHDAHVGAFGASALMLDFLFQCAVLMTVYGRGVRLCFAAVVTAQVCGRLAMTLCAALGVCASNGEEDKQLINGADWRHAVWASAMAALCLLPFLGFAFWIPMLAAAFVALIATLFFKITLGGASGATLGAAHQLAQAFVLMMFLWERINWLA